MLNKRLINTGAEAAAAFDPLQNFETVTYTGNGSTQKITGYIRKGAAFNGSSSQIEATNPIISETAFSLSAWINLNSTSTSNHILSVFDTATSSRKFIFRVQSGGAIRFLTYDSSGNTSANATSSSGTITVGTWHHVVAVENSGTTTVYVDGTSVATDSGSNDANTVPTASLNFGGRDDFGSTSNERMDGKIDQVRIFNKAISSSEVTTLYNEDYDSSTKSTTDIFGDGSGVALYELDEDANESYFGQSFSADSTTRYISTGISNNDIEAFSFWFYFVSGSSVGRPLGSTTRYSENLAVEVGSNGSISAQLQNQMLAAGSGTLGSTGWKHVYYDTGRTLYVNGVSVSGSSTTSSEGNSSAIIGGLRTNYGFYNNKIDDVRYYSSTLNATQIGYLADNDLSNLDSIPNLLAHFKLDGNAVDETGTYTATEVNAQYSTGVYGGTPTNVNFLGMAFQPDFVWIKNRGGFSHHIQDVIRGSGARKDISSDGTWAEGTYNYGSIDSFDSNGFTVGSGGHSQYGTAQVNDSGDDYVAWCWKAGGAAVSGSGTNVSSVTQSENAAAGFGIYRFTTTSSDNTNITINHNLNAAPEMVIAKETSGSGNWYIYHSVLGAGKYLQFNTNAATTASSAWGAGMTSSVIGARTAQSVDSGETHVMYAFHSVDGYQKIGSYTGTGTTNSFTGFGFEPRWIMIKRSDSTGNWWVFDNSRGNNKGLRANLSNAEDTTDADANTNEYRINFLSDGFQYEIDDSTSASGDLNALNGTYIYLAIA